MSQPDNTPANEPEDTTANRPDYDSAWKTSLEKHFEAFLALLFPKHHAEVDWSKGYEFLDGELNQITKDAKTGRRYADKLVKVHTLKGAEEWLLIHVEVQGDPQADFAERMYTYSCLLYIRYKVIPESLAVFTDLNANFRPSQFNFQRFQQGTQLDFSYPIAKLLDYETEQEWANLEASDNVFALVVMSQIKAKRLKGNEEGLLTNKIALIRELYRRDYTVEQIKALFIVIDWMIYLPTPQVKQFSLEMRAIEKESNKMIYTTSIEQLARDEAREEAEKRAEQRFAQERQEAEARAAQERLQERRETVRQLLSANALNNLTDEQIAQTFKLTLEEVADMRLSSKH